MSAASTAPRFSSTRGHDALKERLARAVDTGKLPPTCLFVGPQGRGKRTLVLALAAEVLRGGARAGREADVERRVLSGTHPDLEILTPLVDERFLPVKRVRALLERCALTPADGSRRVVIVPRLERVNEESGNALLKFFEEPSEGTSVFATAPDPRSVLETLRSRSVIFRAEPLSDADVVAVAVATGTPREAAETLAPLAEGAPGRIVRLCRGDVDAALYAPLRELFDATTSPYRFAEARAKEAKDRGPTWAEAEAASAPRAYQVAEAELRAEKEGDGGGGGTSEAARNWLRPMIDAVAFAARDAAREAYGAAPRAPAFLATIGCPRAEESRALARLERVRTAAFEALENLDRNLSLPLLLEVLARAAKPGS
jgi:DNA polymerase III subunit delta'